MIDRTQYSYAFVLAYMVLCWFDWKDCWLCWTDCMLVDELFTMELSEKWVTINFIISVSYWLESNLYQKSGEIARKKLVKKSSL